MQERLQKAHRITLIGLLINLALTFFKITAGIIGQSSAIIADAFHSLSDFATDIVVLWGMRAAYKPIDKDHDYGHGKIETLMAGLVGLVLFLVGWQIFWQGVVKIWKFYNGEIFPSPGNITLLAAVVSILVKEWLYRRTVEVGKTIESQAVIANAWHHRSDAFSSVGVMIGIGGAIFLGEQWRVLDPFAAAAVSLFIMYAAFKVAGSAVGELTDASLCEDTEKEILKIVRDIQGVKNPHNLRTRRIGRDIAVEVHIKVEKALNITQAHDLSTRVENKLKERFGPGIFVSVHVEPEG